MTPSEGLIDPFLEEILGNHGYHEFLRSYLRHRGYTKEQVEQVLPATH